MEQILIRMGVGLIGILFYAFMTARDKNDKDTLNIKMYFKNNILRWGLAVCILMIVSIFIEIAPEGGVLIKSATGLDVTAELASFGSLGYFLVSAGRKIKQLA